jgi:hypothetical protein
VTPRLCGIATRARPCLEGLADRTIGRAGLPLHGERSVTIPLHPNEELN